MKKVYFKTFGCRTNIYDTEVMKAKLKEFELTEKESEAEVVVVNSCTVTNGADSGVRNYINQLSKRGVKVIMAGCGVFNNGETFLNEGKVFGVLGHSKKHEINSLLKLDKPFIKLGDLKSLDDEIITSFHGKTKAFIKIQEGCNFRCSYCIIPYVRGNSRSYKTSSVIKQIEKLTLEGYNEFVLTGTNIGSYGKEHGTNLGELLQNIGKISGIKRIRLGSIEPVQIDESFKEILNEPWLERHLHIALQHTNEEVLRIMRRRNNLHEDLELFYFLKDLGFALGTDYIVGHPGEDEKNWKDGLKNFKKFPITHLHGFIYSKRDGTPSASMKLNIDKSVAKKRLKILQDIVQKSNLEFRKEHQTPLEVHVESFKGGFFVGYDQFYNQMRIESKKNLLKSWQVVDDFKVKEEYNESNI